MTSSFTPNSRRVDLMHQVPNWRVNKSNTPSQPRLDKNHYSETTQLPMEPKTLVSKATIAQQGKTVKAQVKEVALYMRDTFDFIDEQYLGHWNSRGMAIHLPSGISSMIDKEWSFPIKNDMVGWMRPVGNSSYRRYRDLTGMGGDMLLFSDVQYKPVQLTIEVNL